MRRLRGWLLGALAVVAAWYWFGGSGAGLALLWLEARRSIERAPDFEWLETVDDQAITFAWVGRYRVVLAGPDFPRREVFRDELSETDWVRLRRRCCAVQPATGRSTSI